MAYTRFTASSFVASQPSPHTVSVGYRMTPPLRSTSTARFISDWMSMLSSFERAKIMKFVYAKTGRREVLYFSTAKSAKGAKLFVREDGKTRSLFISQPQRARRAQSCLYAKTRRREVSLFLNRKEHEGRKVVCTRRREIFLSLRPLQPLRLINIKLFSVDKHTCGHPLKSTPPFPASKLPRLPGYTSQRGQAFYKLRLSL